MEALQNRPSHPAPACPHCGCCPHCGRQNPNHGYYPYYPYPYVTSGFIQPLPNVNYPNITFTAN